MPKVQGEDRQPNAEWMATSGADMKVYPVDHHLRRWAYCIWDSTRLYEDWGFDSGGNLGVGVQCTMINLTASSFQDQRHHPND